MLYQLSQNPKVRAKNSISFVSDPLQDWRVVKCNAKVGERQAQPKTIHQDPFFWWVGSLLAFLRDTHLQNNSCGNYEFPVIGKMQYIDNFSIG